MTGQKGEPGEKGNNYVSIMHVTQDLSLLASEVSEQTYLSCSIEINGRAFHLSMHARAINPSNFPKQQRHLLELKQDPSL